LRDRDGRRVHLAATCDLRFASHDAMPSANLAPNGLSGDYEGSIFWMRILHTRPRSPAPAHPGPRVAL
jgi:hypothetical protein